MNVAMRRPMTLAEFLAWEDRQEFKHEFDGVRVIAMSGGTAAHAAIQRNLAVALHIRLRGKPCDFYGSDLKFLTAEGTVRYPDGMVVCAPVEPKAKWSENPTVVFEVLSPSTAKTDRIEKAREYEATPSVQHYVMLEQDAAQAVVYRRDGDRWTHDILLADSALALPAIGLEFPLAELYEGIAFETPEDAETA
jgi:Uma2 family endonuclease